LVGDGSAMVTLTMGVIASDISAVQDYKAGSVEVVKM
jgi:hypothetical protein